MIPIECPKCGRGGSVPPDRLNARLVCKACQCVFHLDNTGRMVMGEPQSFDMKSTKSRADEVSSLADFDFAQTWNDIPAPVKYGVPGAILALILWLNFGSMFGSGLTEHDSKAESIIKALTNGNRDKFISYATSDSAESAGSLYDALHVEIEKGQYDSNSTISPQLFSGEPEKGGEITMLVVVSKPASTDPPLTITLPLKKDSGGTWLLEANAALQAASAASASSGTKK